MLSFFSICLVANTLKETKWFFQYVNVNLWCLASTIMPEASQLIVIFSDALKMSKDYHIAYIHGIGYASVIGVYQKGNKMNSSMQIDVIFGSPQEMADNLLQNWRWQWYYRNRKYMQGKDYADICEIDCDIPESLRENYNKRIQELQNKVNNVLCANGD